MTPQQEEARVNELARIIENRKQRILINAMNTRLRVFGRVEYFKNQGLE